MIRENLVSFRRTIGEKTQENKEAQENITKLEADIEKTKTEIGKIDKNIEKNRIELENIEGALINTGDQLASKESMGELIKNTENLRDTTISLQEKMSHERTVLQSKKDDLDILCHRMTELKSTDQESLFEEKLKLDKEIKILEDNIEELEAQYGIVLDELNKATSMITKVENEILLLQTGSDSAK